MNQSALGQSIIDRALGVLQLNDSTYEEIEHDTAATTQAAIVVAVTAIAGAIGGLSEGAGGFFSGLIGAFIGWAVGAAAVYFVGTRILPSTETEADFGQVLRLIGFASVINVVNILGIFGDAGRAIAGIISLYGIVLFVKAIKHSLEMSTGRAIATAIGAFIAVFIVIAIIAAIFGAGTALS
jgi:hypothetical protein